MMAASGMLPRVGDVVRIDNRVVVGLPQGVWLTVLDVRPSEHVVRWAWLTVRVDRQHPPNEREIFVPVASITIYPDGAPSAAGESATGEPA